MLSLVLICFGIAVLAFSLDVFRKPERSLYMFAAGAFLFPKSFQIELGSEELYLERAVQTVLFALVVVALVKNRRLASRVSSFPSLRKFLIAFSVAYAVSTLIPLLLQVIGLWSRPVDASPLRQALLATHYLFALGIFFAAILFLDTRGKIHTLMKLLVVCGVVGLIDFFFLNVLNVAPALREATTGASGGFGGLIFGSPDALGRTAIFAMFSALYLGKVRRSWTYAVLGIAFSTLVIVSASRPVALSLAFAGLFYFWMDRRAQGARLVYSTALVVCLSLTIGVFAFGAEDKLMQWFEARTERSDYFETDVAFYTRLGTWARAADVFLDTFPFGTGGGLLPFYMAGAKGSPVAAHFDLAGSAGEHYEQMVEWRFSSVHNLYVEFIAENGLAGLILFLWFVVRLFQLYRRFRDTQQLLQPEVRYLLTALFTMLAAAALNVMTDSTFKVYWFYLILFYAVEFLIGSPMFRLQNNRAQALAQA